MSSEPSPPQLAPSKDEDDSSQSQVARSNPQPRPAVLPPEKVFSIQSGSELFRLSGASLVSDSPSYFTRFFEDQIRQEGGEGSVKTLYIDRDPTVFHDIARHLQGYHIQPLDGTHYVRLFADAQFYSLPRLISQLFDSETFIRIGDRHFHIPRDIFSSRGDTPNFFTLGFAAFFSSPQEVFPGLDRTKLLRPPSIAPPAVPSRSAEVFSQLLHLLRGYPLRIQNEEHRDELLRDCRYFHLRGLEQKLLAHEISYNTYLQSPEILLRLADIKPAQASYDVQAPHQPFGFWIRYQRPYIDTTARILSIEVGSHDPDSDDDDSVFLDFSTQLATINGNNRSRIASIIQALRASKSTSGSTETPRLDFQRQDEKFRFRLDPFTTDITIDGQKFVLPEDEESEVVPSSPSQSRRESVTRPQTRSTTLTSGQGTPKAPKKRKMISTPERSTPSKITAAQEKDLRRGEASTPATGGGGGGAGAEIAEQGREELAGSTTPAAPSAALPSLKTLQDLSLPNHWVVHTSQWRLLAEPLTDKALRVSSSVTGRGGGGGGGTGISIVTSRPAGAATTTSTAGMAPSVSGPPENIPVEIVFVAVKLEVYTSERAKNASRKFLT